MVLSTDLKHKLEETYKYYFNHESILKMKEISIHRGSSCYIHTFKVTKKVMKKAIKSHKFLDLENLLIACIFHDYYLYSWRLDKSKRKHHGKEHPLIAGKNAKRDFNIPDKAVEMIKTHMWPINLLHPPKGKEARLLCSVDTNVAIVEFLTSKKHKQKKEASYLKKLENLFD